MLRKAFFGKKQKTIPLEQKKIENKKEIEKQEVVLDSFNVKINNLKKETDILSSKKEDLSNYVNSLDVNLKEKQEKVLHLNNIIDEKENLIAGLVAKAEKSQNDLEAKYVAETKKLRIELEKLQDKAQDLAKANSKAKTAIENSKQELDIIENKKLELKQEIEQLNIYASDKKELLLLKEKEIEAVLDNIKYKKAEIIELDNIKRNINNEIEVISNHRQSKEEELSLINAETKKAKEELEVVKAKIYGINKKEEVLNAKESLVKNQLKKVGINE